jgi:hypothetical protein
VLASGHNDAAIEPHEIENGGGLSACGDQVRTSRFGLFGAVPRPTDSDDANRQNVEVLQSEIQFLDFDQRQPNERRDDRIVKCRRCDSGVASSSAQFTKTKGRSNSRNELYMKEIALLAVQKLADAAGIIVLRPTQNTPIIRRTRTLNGGLLCVH